MPEIEGVSDVASVDVVWVVNKFESDVVSDIAIDVIVESATEKLEGGTAFGRKGDLGGLVINGRRGGSIDGC